MKLDDLINLVSNDEVSKAKLVFSDEKSYAKLVKEIKEKGIRCDGFIPISVVYEEEVNTLEKFYAVYAVPMPGAELDCCVVITLMNRIDEEKHKVIVERKPLRKCPSAYLAEMLRKCERGEND